MIDYDKLRQHRLDLGLRQIDVARYLGYASQNAYSSIESGRTRLRIDVIEKLAKLFHVPLSFFLATDTNLLVD